MRLAPSRGPRATALLATLLFAVAAPLAAQRAVTAPEAFFGHPIGADYVLPDYEQLVDYWRMLDAESERMTLVDIGATAEGRRQVMAIVTAPENHARLDRYRDIARRLALAEGLTDSAARALAGEGKAVVWIDGGLHATEVLGPQQLIETVHQLVSRDDAETLRILNDVIVLAVHANPDGMELVSNWYMRTAEPTHRSLEGVPRLYQKYVGHDNNRDFFASTQPETENMNRVMYREWFPQIMYNHHQTGPSGQVMFAPPFREPYNQVVHPLVRAGIELVGAAMHGRFIAEDKPGVGTREGAGYSTWWNGGLRSTAYFHNIIGLLTETKGSPSPHVADVRSDIPLIPQLQLPTSIMPFPIAPQRWTFRRSVDYSVTANYAVLDAASRYREQFLYNSYKMASDAIEQGSRDHWTTYPRRTAALSAAMDSVQERDGYTFSASCARVRTGMPLSVQRPCMAVEEAQPFVHKYLRAPELRDPRGYIISADQPDFPTAVKFVNALLETGVAVHRATAAFTAGGTQYPAGSYVVQTAQAFRPHVLDMFEPQDHPNDFEYPGGPPIHPYDAAGWTLALQMGVAFDRLLDAFDGPFERVTEWNVRPWPAALPAASAAGYLLSPRTNDAFRAVSQLLAAGDSVYRLHGAEHAGSFYIPATAATRARIARIATERGVDVAAAPAMPEGDHDPLRQPRIGLWDEYGGSMPSGWTRWILEQFEIPHELVFAAELDAGNLRDRYDVLVFVDGAIPARDGGAADQPAAADVPAEYRAMLGQVTVASTVPRLREFLDAGGTVITIGRSTILARHLGLPVGDHLVVPADSSGGTRALRGEEYFIPASVLDARVDTTHPIAYGMGERVNVTFDDSPVFVLGPDAAARGIRRIAWFDDAEPLQSGWAWGQHHLEGGVVAAEARVGAGTLLLFGPEILFRAQPHGTFPLFFNGLYHTRATDQPSAGAATR